MRHKHATKTSRENTDSFVGATRAGMKHIRNRNSLKHELISGSEKKSLEQTLLIHHGCCPLNYEKVLRAVSFHTANSPKRRGEAQRDLETSPTKSQQVQARTEKGRRRQWRSTILSDVKKIRSGSDPYLLRLISRG
ncbi:hypothetical protein DY000_02061388 [Brassica cretica]|uniref:Uncharacterized protein n=1 Tax=Brassica cretica TaxID=69181 RepID=A0ABQ7AXJ3_BRACR|nr:hypothetical protein DY000_02061388 [Brassica cretica]